MTTGLRILKITFSVFGVLCLLLAGNTAVNFAKTMESYSVVTVVPTSVEVGEYTAYYIANITYTIDNPSKLDIEVIWTEVLITFVYGTNSSDIIDTYDFRMGFSSTTGRTLIDEGKTGEIVMSWYLKKDKVSDASIFANRDINNTHWESYIKMKFRPVDFENTDYITTSWNALQEVP